ncbi:MAG: ArnT family glycosyltransferase, partial [Anaerolineales bacterium]
ATLEETAKNKNLSVVEVETVVNDLSLPLWATVPAKEAIKLAIETAEELDNQLEKFPKDLLEEIYNHNQRLVVRALHRNEHLGEIKEALNLTANDRQIYSDLSSAVLMLCCVQNKKRTFTLHGKSGDMKYITTKDCYWILPLSTLLGAFLSSIQNGGWLPFSFLFLLSFLILTISMRWANDGKTLIWIVALAFIFRFGGGVATYLALPIYGYIDDEDQSAGFVYTDAHRRDTQAWELAISEQPILNAFNKKFAYDQYGGLLAFSAFIYRYLSPDEHRVLLLVLISALMGTLAIPFLYKSANLLWDEKTASASTFILALYPENILLAGSAMREPYLLAFSAFALWGFANWQKNKNKKLLIWLVIGIAGMLLVSPSIALVTLIILAGWYYFDSGRGQVSWWMILIVIIIFLLGLFILSSALTRGNLTGDSPLAVINNFIRESLKWNVFKIEAGSGWVQKLFDEMKKCGMESLQFE